MIRIVKKNGTIFELSDLMKIKQFDISSPNPITDESVVPGVDGHIDNGTTYKGREITIGGNILASSYHDHKDIREELFKIFDSKDFFSLIEHGEELRKWRVKLNGAFVVERINPIFFSVTVQLKSDIPYSTSIESTINRNPDEFIKFENTFSIYNDGNIIIDPKKWFSDLIITFKGASNELTILNDTTGDSFTYYGETIANDVVMIQNLRVLKNDNSITRNTNLKLIQLIQGNNDFVISGNLGSFEISFDFRELYL